MPLKVNCWNEYDTLKTVILGNVYDSNRVPNLYHGKDQESLVKIVEQTHAELAEIKLIMQQHDVQVLQSKHPQAYHNAKHLPHSPLINMRDFHMAYGKMFFLTHGSYVTRRFQHAWLEDIINEMILDDNLVIAANEPNFQDLNFSELRADDFEARFKQIYKEKLDGKNLFHTACILKHNKTAFCSIVSGSTVGEKWMRNWLAQQDVTMVFANKFGHIDGSNSILNQDTLLTCHQKSGIWRKHFKNIIACPTVDEWWVWRQDQSISRKVKNPTDWLYEFQGHFQDFNAEANALSLDPQTVMLSFYDKTFYDMLKNDHGITAIYASWKNRHFWGGGLHCITCDLERSA